MKKIRALFAKYNNLSIQKKAALWYTFCNIIQKGILFLIIPIYTRVLSTTEYGKYSTFLSWKDIIMIFATLNLYCGVFTKAMVDYADDRDNYTSSIQTLSSIVTFFLALLYYITNKLWGNFVNMDIVTVYLLFIFYLVYPAFQFWTCRQCVEYKYVRMVITTLVVSIAIPVLSVLLLFNTDLREKSVIYGYLIIQILVGSFFYIRNYVRGRVLFKRKYWMYALKFNIPLIPHYMSMIILSQSDRIMIDNMCGSDKTGIYSLAAQVSHVIGIITGAIHSSFTPWIYGRLKKVETRHIGSSCNMLCLFIAILIILVNICAPEIVSILSTKEYREAVTIIPVLSIGMFFTFVYGFFSDVEFYYGATYYVMVASVFGAVANIILNVIFIPVYGYLAAAYTTSFCYLIFLALHYCFMQKVCKRNRIDKKIFNINVIILISISLVILSTLCIVLYKYLVIRYLIFFGLLVTIIGFKKKMKQALLYVKEDNANNENN